MKVRVGLARYGHIGAVYDVLSLERWVYRRPRQRLHEMIGARPGATVVDAGCGTGLNFEGLVRLVGPSGRVIGIDASPSMLTAAVRRSQAVGWDNVITIKADITDLTGALGAAGIQISSVDAVVATFVVSTLRDPSSFWRAIDQISATQPVLVALAEIGLAEHAPRPIALVLNAFAALGGNRRQSQPWNDLAARSPDVVTEQQLDGHVHLALGHVRPVTER